MNELKLYAKHFYNLGLNVTAIANYLTEENFYSNNILKHPYHQWTHFITQRQTVEEFENYDWSNILGIGIVCGFNDFTVIDIDGCLETSFLNEILIYLKLPTDYEWIIQTGSRTGYHIVIKNNLKFIRGKLDFSKDQSCYSFEPNARFKRKFKRIEILKKLHVVFPPSYHSSGHQYRFLNCEIPKESIKDIDGISLSRLVSKYCVATNTENSFFTLFSTPVQFIKSDYESFTIKEFMSNLNNSTEKIGSGFRFSYTGDDLSNNSPFVKYDINKWKNSQVALLFDIETDGLINGTHYPAILQISWIVQLTNENGTLIKRESYLITNQYLQSNAAYFINNIDIKKANKIGFSLEEVLKKFYLDVKDVDIIVAHNLDFDLAVMKHYLVKSFFEIDFDKKVLLCTMKDSNMYKEKQGYLNLIELHEKLCGIKITNAHDAGIDTLLLSRCFNILLQNGSFSYKLRNN